MAGKSTACGIGYHILHDKMSPAQRARLLEHLAVAQPATVNVTGADAYPDSLGYVQRILETCPQTIVFERRVDRPPAFKVGQHVQDEGIWQIDTEAWYAWRVTPYLSILSHPRVVVVYDNESNMGDFTPYAEKMAAAAKRADKDGVALGLGRFSTGNPGEAQYGEQLWRMFELLSSKTSRHWWTPNEYMGPDAQSSAGHVARYQHGLAQIKKSQSMNVAIGEWAICQPKGTGLDPHHSVKQMGWSDEQMLDYMIVMFQAWYQHPPSGSPHSDRGRISVPVNVYAPDNQDTIWRRFTVGEAFYEAVEARLGEMQIPWPPKAFSGDVEPVPEYTETRAVLRNMGGDKPLFVREGPSTATAKVGRITTGMILWYQWPPVDGDAVGNVGSDWIKVRVAGVLGYAHGHYLAVPEMEVPTPISPPHSDGEGTKEAPVEDTPADEIEPPDEVCLVDDEDVGDAE